MNNNLIDYSLNDIQYLKVHGRTTGDLNPLALFWTGSGIEVNIRATEFWMEVEVDYDLYEQWIVIEINGSFISRQMLTKGRYFICIFRGMDKNKIKNVRIYKEVQAMNSDNNCIFLIHSLKTDGFFEEVIDKKLKIEFIGDSITSGEGTMGAKGEEEWIPMWFSSYNNYANMTAKSLNADYRILSQSGWGVLSSWDNDPRCALPNYYEQICGVLNGEKNEKLGCHKLNDFEKWKPDIIIINLGTNDDGAFNSPEFKDEITGETFKQHKNEDSTYNVDDIRKFEYAAVKFLYKLRMYNKTSKIVWCYGMLGLPIMRHIYNAVNRYIYETNDNNVYVTQLTKTNDETVGSRCHPGISNHEIASNELVNFIKNEINLN